MPTTDEMFELVGKDLAPSEWFLIDQDRVNQFADATLDHSFSHVDLVAAEKIGGTIVHGLLILSLLPHLTASHNQLPDGCTIGLNYGFDRVRFASMVRVGKRIRVEPKLSVWERYRETGWRMVLAITVAIEGETKPAMYADWTIIYR